MYEVNEKLEKNNEFLYIDDYEKLDNILKEFESFDFIEKLLNASFTSLRSFFPFTAIQLIALISLDGSTILSLWIASNNFSFQVISKYFFFWSLL